MNNLDKPWYKKWWGVLALLMLALFFSLIFAFIFIFFNTGKTTSKNKNTLLSQKMPSQVLGSEKNYWLGSANPKITIVEFADFNCHYCKQSFPKIREISQTYNKDIKYIFRDFPLISEFSAQLALAARCAGEQGLFWVMHDKLYINQGISTDEDLLKLFKQIGGNEAKFSACYSSNKYLPEIEKDLADGKTLNITGTPTWFVNGTRLEGDVPYEYFINLINSIIKVN